MKEFYEKLIKIQSELKAPKNQRNGYGNYNYRSCEDIFEAVKPLLRKYNLVLTVNDELVLIGDRYYIKATATLTDGTNNILNTAYAREEETKKGMDGSQITGSSSSYARKYALNGLFLIDDVKDSDYTNTGDSKVKVRDVKEVKEDKGSNRIVLINKITELELELDIPHEKTLEIYKVDTLNKMTDEQLQDCINKMEKVRNK